MNKAILLALSVSIPFATGGLVACQKDEPPPVETPKAQGRAETKNIRNTDAIGYSGGAIADKVDSALDKNDQHIKDVEQQSQEQ
jgi:hypothetical protein